MQRCSELEEIVAQQQELLNQLQPSSAPVQPSPATVAPSSPPGPATAESALNQELLAQCEQQALRMSRMENQLRKTEQYAT